MKKWEKVILILVSLVCAGLLIAAQFGAPPGTSGRITVVFLPENTFTVMTANTLGFTSAVKDIGFTTDKLSVLVTWGGTAPTNIASALLGSIDNVSFVTLKANTQTASPAMYFNTAGQRVRYVKGYYASKSGGSTDTTLSMKVTAGGN